MTQDELHALGERWKACPGFRWRPGMLRRHGRDLRTRVMKESLGGKWEGWPDVSDPATRGCLLEDVREALGYDVIVTYREDEEGMPEGWEIRVPARYGALRRAGPYDTEIEALIAALEAAPR